MKRLQILLLVSVLAGLAVGSLNSLVQHVTTVPLILQAEVYEKAGEAGAATHADASMKGMDMAAHSAEAWEPADGTERTLYSLAANIVVATAFAFVVTGLMSMKSAPISLAEAFGWGLAGFVIMSLAPSLGLPPELPGSVSAELEPRQMWWIATVLATAAGIGLLYLRREPWAIVLAAVLLLAPHLIGAPQVGPGAGESLAPDALEARFIFAALLMSLISWLVLAPLCRALLNRTLFRPT